MPCGIRHMRCAALEPMLRLAASLDLVCKMRDQLCWVGVFARQNDGKFE